MGILESRKRVGLIVAKPDVVGLFEFAVRNLGRNSDDLWEIGELRYAVELGAIELAAKYASDDQLKRLLGFAEEMDSPCGPSDAIELDFHRTILESTQNSIIAGMCGVLETFFKGRYRDEENGYENGQQVRQTALMHRMIAEALADRDAEQARILSARHLAPYIRTNVSNRSNLTAGE